MTTTHILPREELRSMTRGVYDLQKLRIQSGNRIVANFKRKLGIKPSEKENTAKVEKEDKALVQIIKLEYDRLTDGVVNSVPTRKTWKGTESELISKLAEFQLVRNYVSLLKAEKDQFDQLRSILEEFEIWNDFLEPVKGIGPAMGAVIISELDPHKAEYASSFWKYCGLDVVMVDGKGEGRSKRKEHLIDVQYTDKDGNLKIKKSITFNPFIKTKLVGVLGTSFLRAGKSNHYPQIYYNYKNRLENHPDHKDKTKAHRHRMAIRYMVKMFLIDLYEKWRAIEGLPVNDPYHVAKLGLKRHAA